MGPVTAIRLYLTQWLNFSGRARRFEIFWYILFHIAMILIFVWLFVSTGNGAASLEAGTLNSAGQGAAILAMIYGIFTTIATTALMVRRFHDIGYSGWLVLLFHGLFWVPFLGAVAFLGLWLWLCLGNGTAGMNTYGPDPRFQQSIAFD